MKTVSLTLCLLASSAMLHGQGGPPMQQGDGIWRRNAAFGESQTFDSCLGHQPGSGDYHNHVQPICLRAQLGDNLTLVKTTRLGATYREQTSGLKHSPILGWAIDGYPIYGPYGYSDGANASSPIRRMTPGFRLRAIIQRTSLPDWSLVNHPAISQQLTLGQYGPAVNAIYPLGRYVEDYDYVQELGDLDQYNGRTTVTPEYPNGTYAYFVTIDSSGAPAFPYVIGGQYYGAASGGSTQNVPGAAQEYFADHVHTQPTAGTPLLAAWSTANSSQFAHIVSGFDPAAGPLTTWPGTLPVGAHTSGSVVTPTYADIQHIRYSAASVYVNANGLPSYTAGPWFGFPMNGGVFANFPSAQSYQVQFPLAPAPAATHSSTPMGVAGLWVNGVAVFNFLDGASYSNSLAADQGGGIVAPAVLQVSAASFEGGPSAPGSLIASYPVFNAVIATSTESAASPAWPLTLGGATVTVTDSANTSRSAEVLYASPTQLNFRVPDQTAIGIATVKVTAGGASVTGGINVISVYPNLFSVNGNGLAAGYVLHPATGQTANLAQPVTAGTLADPAYLIIAGSGLGNATSATATIGGTPAQVSYAGAQGTYKGLDQYNILIPPSQTGKGQVDVVITAAGRASNAVNITLQ